MKITKEFAIREIAGDTILVPVGKSALEVSGIITTNDVGAFIWTKLTESDTPTREGLLAALLEEYDVTEADAAADLDEFLGKLREFGVLED